MNGFFNEGRHREVSSKYTGETQEYMNGRRGGIWRAGKLLTRRYGAAALLVFLGFDATRCCLGVTNYVSTTGNDTNSGSAAFPWRSVQMAANTMNAGDTAIVLAGAYGESVTTSRGGTGETSRITFQGQGNPVLRSFSINRTYITLSGFDFTGQSGSLPSFAYVQVSANGSHFQIFNNVIRDGVSIVSSNLVFTNSPNNTISSSTGGFTNAGFQAGMSLYVMDALSNNVLLNANRNAYTISNVTDTVITLAPGQVLSNQGPTLAYLDASFVYGLIVSDGAAFGVVCSNTFQNLDYNPASFGGNNNLYEYNILEQCNGWNGILFSGHDNTYFRNLIQNSPLKTYADVSPDVFEPNGHELMYHLVFEENFVTGFVGVLSAHTATNINAVFERNVFAGSSIISATMPNESFINNTFYEVANAASASPVNTAGNHPIVLQNGPDLGYGGGVIENNIFLGCGLPGVSNGWYDATGITNFVADHNFVAGDAPTFSAKQGFTEGIPALNGGDPGFVGTNNPLGPDGIPFTADDGLQLLSNSKLRGAGQGGVDIGAYVTALASFTASPTNGTAPLAVTFTDTSDGTSPLSLSWNLGDASIINTAGGTNFVHTYAAGNYTVTLTASNSLGSSSVTQTNLITVLSPSLSPFQAWQLQYFGCTNCPQSQPNADPYGKGMSNTNQFLAGFNPTNSAAYVHIISIANTNTTGIKVVYLGANGDSTWSPGIASRTNVLEFTAGTASGGYSNNFVSANVTNILSGGTGTGLVTNMVDIGGATNTPSRYYRVRVLVP